MIDKKSSFLFSVSTDAWRIHKSSAMTSECFWLSFECKRSALKEHKNSLLWGLCEALQWPPWWWGYDHSTPSPLAWLTQRQPCLADLIWRHFAHAIQSIIHNFCCSHMPFPLISWSLLRITIASLPCLKLIFLLSIFARNLICDMLSMRIICLIVLSWKPLKLELRDVACTPYSTGCSCTTLRVYSNISLDFIDICLEILHVYRGFYSHRSERTFSIQKFHMSDRLAIKRICYVLIFVGKLWLTWWSELQKRLEVSISVTFTLLWIFHWKITMFSSHSY